MTLKVVVSEAASEDLIAAWLYIAEENLEAADAFVDRVASIGQKLSQWPDLGKARPELRHDLRSFPTDNYLVYYRQRNEVIEIVAGPCGFLTAEWSGRAGKFSERSNLNRV